MAVGLDLAGVAAVREHFILGGDAFRDAGGVGVVVGDIAALEEAPGAEVVHGRGGLYGRRRGSRGRT